MNILRKLSLLTGIALFSLEAVYAQLALNKPLDQILTQYQGAESGDKQVEFALQMADYYMFKSEATRIDIDSAFVFIKRAEKKNNELHSLKWREEILYFLSEYYYKVGDINKGKQYSIYLSNTIGKLKSIENQIQIWHRIAFILPKRDTIGLTKLNCFERITALYQRLNNTVKVLETQMYIADVHLMQDKFDLAEKEFFQLLANYKAIHFPNLHYVYNYLSVINNRRGDYKKCLHYSLLCVESMEKTNDKAGAVNLYSRLANIYHELGQTENCIRYYRKVFNCPISNPVDFYTVREAGLFVRELIALNRHKEAFSFIKTFSNEHPPADYYGKASLARTFAYYYNNIHNQPVAEKYNEQMIEFANFLGKYNEITGDVEYDIGCYYYEKKQFANAIIHFKKALFEASHVHAFTTIRDIQKMLFKADSSGGDYLSAINHLNQAQLINNTIFNEAKNKQIQEVQVKYETAKKDLDIRFLTEQGLLQKTQLQQANNLKNVTLVSIVLLLLIVALLYNRYMIKLRNSRRLERHQKEINDKNESLQALVSEKEWLLKELHHRVKNNLQLTISLLHTQSKYLSDQGAIRAIEQSQHRVRAMALIHQKLYRSDSLSHVDMSTYIREVVDQLEESFNHEEQITFHYQLAPLELDVSQAIPLGLIITEAITNALKYAFPAGYQSDEQGGTINLSLTQVDDENYQLVVEDDGVGLPEDVDLRRQGSMGANIMRRLTKQLGGIFQVETKGGVRISVSFPVIKLQPHHAHLS
ncbi:sensor histidine kinase [Spirosoma sp. KCTC 42546]|uniref:sensor histidine kinase n=1 Tax=Spirosoma sp. KCTC 42546 TaxID=2520506 RepID=UPI00115BBA53|nr:sensor histidine kinase [Spirosoma sp. KCTC 42546]QDK77534.1 sensor histidine kinase [Spirosoma sp. KCTC 42546]